jgi:hypothetical protein
VGCESTCGEGPLKGIAYCPGSSNKGFNPTDQLV